MERDGGVYVCVHGTVCMYEEVEQVYVCVHGERLGRHGERLGRCV